ncbi:MAG: T9SS type A sorting domain-containing protein, partial [Candidatus Neomarinimicrobiota bacterium]|nr:T9SS type A sorting domain-containing protein [Candidatus Neomarinimicrobiota bacterium]
YYRVAAYTIFWSLYSDVISVTLEWLDVDNERLPTFYVIHQNYPNPFNPSTTIRYDLPVVALVKIIIYDMMGRKVSTLISSHQTAGFNSVRWNATNDKGAPVSAGLYLYTIQAGEFRQTKKMVLLK